MNVEKIFNIRFRGLVNDAKKKNNQITHAKIAQDLGISPQVFSSYLRGRMPKADMLVKISEYFDVSVDYLLGICNCRNRYEDAYVEKLGLSTEEALLISRLRNVNKGITDKYNLEGSDEIADVLQVLLSKAEGIYVIAILKQLFYKNIMSKNESECVAAVKESGLWGKNAVHSLYMAECTNKKVQDIFLDEIVKALRAFGRYK